MWSCFSVAQEPIEAAKSKIYKKKLPIKLRLEL
jgi:hypothetical protein